MTETLTERARRRRGDLSDHGHWLIKRAPASPVGSVADERIDDGATTRVRPRSDSDQGIEDAIAGIDIVKAYTRWCGKMEPIVTGKREGIEVSCPIPGHLDTHPSAWLNLDKNTWYCGACSVGGDIYDIAAWHFGFEVPGYKHGAAFVHLRQQMAEDVGYSVPWPPSGTTAPEVNTSSPATVRVPFQFRSAAEFAAIAHQPFEWLVTGMLVSSTYGMLAGEQKTLKSYISAFIDLSIATGTELFGTFAVTQAPVVCFVGEGGDATFGRRLDRIAHALDVDLADADLHGTTSVAPIGSPVFVEALQRSLDEFHPGLVHLDPYYAYHGITTNSANLHEEGALLTSLSAPCMEAGSSLLLNNHFSKTGRGTGLSRITQAGGGEWSDTWILVSKLEENVAEGRFKLLLEIGSRQWGGGDWVLDLDVGRYDETAGDWTGDITFAIERQAATATTQAGKALREDPLVAVVRIATERPFEMTPTGLAKEAGGNARKARQAVDAAIAQGLLVPRETRDGWTRLTTVVGPPDPP